MKITTIETICLSRLHELENQWFTNTFRMIKADCVIVLVHTDDGVTGIGEACAYGGPEQIRDWVAFYTPLMRGKDPLDMSISPPPHYRSSAHDCAIAGIDCALWDIRGKAAGKSVAQLLVSSGLTARTEPALTEVRLYASSGCRYDWRDDPHQLIREALGYIDQGYTAMKFRIGTHWDWDGVTVDRFLGLARELHQAVRATGKRFDLAMDANQRLTEAQALPIAKELERLGFAWFEEPIPQTDIAGYARLAASVEMPITGGEQFTTLEQFQGHIAKKAYDVVQPDVGWCGITEALRIAECATQHGIRVLPHSWHNGLMVTASAQYIAALPAPIACEQCMIQGPLQWSILRDRPPIVNGHLVIGNTPGLGVTLADNLEQTFPYFTGAPQVTVERN